MRSDDPESWRIVASLVGAHGTDDGLALAIRRAVEARNADDASAERIWIDVANGVLELMRSPGADETLN
jgi:hypothetical protein